MKNLKKIASVALLVPMGMLFVATSAYSQEVPARGPIPFAAYDKNGDGAVSVKEFDATQAERMRKRAAQGMPAPFTDPPFILFDTNKDGKLSQAELQAGQKKQMEVRRAQALEKAKSTNPKEGSKATEADPRILVIMPDKAKAIMRKDMQQNMIALNSIIGYLTTNDLKAAADVAEKSMGKSAMGKHMGSGAAPGWFMTEGMKSLALGLHDAASNFAVAARQGNMDKTLKALQEVTSTCASCHASHRIR